MKLNLECEIVNKDITECYGTKRIKDNVDQCKYRNKCQWGEACLSRASEYWQDKHYHRANISVAFMNYDPAQKDNSSSHAEKNALYVENPMDETEETSNDIELEGITIPYGQYDVVKQTVNTLAEMYFKTPMVFETMMKCIFNKQRQADVAREKKITRQGLNKRLLSELGIAQKRNDIQHRREKELQEEKQKLALARQELEKKQAFIKFMSNTDFVVYKICALDGCLSVSSIANLTGFTRKTIYKSIQNLRENFGVSIHIQPYHRNKKTRKQVK